VRKLSLVGVLALVASGCGSSGGSSTTIMRNTALDQSAARFVVRVQADLRRGRFQQVWRSLHAAQKRVVSAERLASCYPRNRYPQTVTFRATEVRDVSWQVPGTTGLSDAEAVMVTAKSGGKTLETFDQHIVRSNGNWRWMLSRAFFAKAKRGAC
jgi:hypothetical protein